MRRSPAFSRALSHLPMTSGGSCQYRKAFSASREWCGIAAARQALQDLVRDQRLFATSSEAHGPAFRRPSSSHQSKQGANCESLFRRQYHYGTFRAKIHESQTS